MKQEYQKEMRSHVPQFLNYNPCYPLQYLNYISRLQSMSNQQQQQQHRLQQQYPSTTSSQQLLSQQNSASSSYLSQFQSKQQNSRKQPSTLQHSSRKQISHAIQTSIKGLHRYEQHLGIEVSNQKQQPQQKFSMEASKGSEQSRQQQIDYEYKTNSSLGMASQQEMKQSIRYTNNHNKNKKRVQFAAEESLESSIYDTNQVTEDEDDPEEDDDLLQVDQHDDFVGNLNGDLLMPSIGDKITNKQMQPKEGFNKKTKLPTKTAGRKAGAGTGPSQQTYSKLNKNKSNQQIQSTYTNTPKLRNNYQSTSSIQMSKKTVDNAGQYNPKLAFREQLKLIDLKINKMIAEDMPHQTQSHMESTSQMSNHRTSRDNRGNHHFTSLSRGVQQKSAMSSRGGSQRRILSLDRASSTHNQAGPGIAACKLPPMTRDTSLKTTSKQKLRRKGSGGLVDFQPLKAQKMRKRIYNTVLERKRNNPGNGNGQKSANILSPRAKFDPKDKKFGKVQITNINVKASAKQNLQEILGNQNKFEAELQLQQQYSSSNTADHYEDKYLNTNINNYMSNQPTAQNGNTRLDSLNGSDKMNYRSFENIKKPTIELNLIDDANNNYMANDFTHQLAQSQQIQNPNQQRSIPQNNQDVNGQQMLNNAESLSVRSDLSVKKKNARNSQSHFDGAGYQSAYFPTPKGKTQRVLGGNQQEYRTISNTLSESEQSVPGSRKANGAKQNQYYLTQDRVPPKQISIPQSSRNKISLVSGGGNNSKATNEAGSVYKTDFSANKGKHERSGKSHQTSQKSDSLVSHNYDTMGFSHQNENEMKYHEMVKKKNGDALQESSVIDADLTIENDTFGADRGIIKQMPSNMKSHEELPTSSLQNLQSARQTHKQKKQIADQQQRYNSKTKTNNNMKKSATSSALLANSRKQVLDHGPFQRTDAMLLDPQAISVQPESEALSQSHKPGRKKQTYNQQQQNEDQQNKNFLKQNIGDFKMKILGAMHTTNQAIQNAGKKQDGPDSMYDSHGRNNNQIVEYIQKDFSKTSGKDRNPSALQTHPKNQSLVPETIFPSANSEVQNIFDFNKSGDVLRQFEEDKSNSNSEIQFRATERSHKRESYSNILRIQQQQNQGNQLNNQLSQNQQVKDTSNQIGGAIEINKDDLDDLYRQSEKLDMQIKQQEFQENQASMNVVTNRSESNMGGPFPNRYDRFHSPHRDYSSKLNPQGSLVNHGGYMNRASRYNRSNSKYSQMNNQFEMRSRANTSSKIDELMKNQKIQEILLEPNDQFENLLMDQDLENGIPQNDIEQKVETLLSLLNNFMLRHGVTQLQTPGIGGTDTEDKNNTAQKSTIAEGFSPSEQFLLNAIDKLSNYIEVLQARETAQKHQVKSGTTSDAIRRDYPGIAATPNSMFASNKLTTLSPTAQKDAILGRQAEGDLGVYQKLAHAEIKMKRLISQISEMNIEYKCQKTQVEALEKFNESLNNQIKRLEQQLYETQSQIHHQSKVGSGVFGVAGGPDRTPRQIIFEERMRSKEQGLRSRERMSSLQLQMQAFDPAKSSTDFNNHGNYTGQNIMGPLMFSPKSTKTQDQPGNEPFKSVEVTEVASAQGVQQQHYQNPTSQFNWNER